ncbi:hypothetical protein PVL29_018569 [Vitis rotundifolia]|uniref:Retrotransposon Copia-like N-terminal domain-containing protein n=1 Tax=Vitis rotundifolia TaxID=103349 RepID=A0AA38Z5B2_VITRO|nr:hypothetical protein PVL29_018569 [Vitis rotundifolia]
MITIKLSPSNYLFWKSQLLSFLESQDLLGYVNGTLVPPPRFEPATSTTLSTKYLLMKRDTKLVAEYAHTFKTLCDQLHAIGRPVEDTNKVHWFLHGLGTDFFSFFYRSDGSHPSPLFELFQRSLESSDSTTAAFTTTNRGRTTSHGTPFASRGNQRGRSHSHGNNSSNQGRTHSGQGRQPPRCQICRMEDHYADRCNQRYARTDSFAHLAKAFNTSCSLSGPEVADWFLDTRASAHMTTDPSILDQSKNYMGKDSMIVGNSASLSLLPTLVLFLLFQIFTY